MISVIIPAYNEEAVIKKTLQWLLKADADNRITEIIVVDGGSTDGTVKAAQSEGVNVLLSPKKGRAAQMNYGASLACGKIFYFLHADTLPPLSFTKDISHAVSKGCNAGCYRLSFDYNHWFLKANCWFTRFNINAFRFGDQSLFVAATMFTKAGGFCENHIVMEDQHFIIRLKKISKFIIFKRPVLSSARKYLANGIYKTQAVFFLIFMMYQLGYSQRILVKTYKKLIRQDKL